VIEATLEALQTGAIVAIQDMGAAGLTCSTVEMASKGGVGMNVDLDLVPMRESDMTGYELMLSESQERMMCVAQAGREQEVIDVFNKWGLPAVVIGTVNDSGRLVVRRFGEVVADLDPKHLTDHCPTYRSTIVEPEYFSNAGKFLPSRLGDIDVRETLLKLLATSDIASKRWVFEQYDQQVQTQTTLAFGRGDAAVLAPRGTQKGIAVKIDGNARHTFFHPYRGGQLAVAEAARNVACTGARPVVATDGLNFGSPTQPHVYWQFERAVKGIADAAEVLGTPVISGNVSFYNESDLGEVLPTPLIGMLGVLENAEDRLPSAPTAPCDLLLIEVPVDVSPQRGLGASALGALLGQEDGYPEAPNLHGEKCLYDFLVEGASEKILLSAHDSSEGGLAVALAEIAMSIGVKATLKKFGKLDLFAEVPGRVIVGTEFTEEVKTMAEDLGLNATLIGVASKTDGLRIVYTGGEISWEKSALLQSFEGSIPAAMAH
jgi:phosphoribosylformylglycinamidine synthase